VLRKIAQSSEKIEAKRRNGAFVRKATRRAEARRD